MDLYLIHIAVSVHDRQSIVDITQHPDEAPKAPLAPYHYYKSLCVASSSRKLYGHVRQAHCTMQSVVR